jgi:hypothetical protein
MTNPIRATLLALTLCALVSAGASAQVDKQDNEVSASAALFKSLQGGPAFLTIAAHYGHLLHDVSVLGTKLDGLQVGGDAIFSGPLDFSTGGSLTLFPTARLYFNAKDPRLSPYVGTGLGVTVYKAADTSFTIAYDINGGVKFFINQTTAAFAQLDLTGPLTDAGNSLLILSGGLSLFF